MDCSQPGSYVQGISQGIILEWHLFTDFFFGLPWVYVSACRLPPAAASRGSSLVAVLGLLTEVAPFVVSTGLRHVGFSSHGIGFGSYTLQALECGPWEPSL